MDIKTQPSATFTYIRAQLAVNLTNIRTWLIVTEYQRSVIVNFVDVKTYNRGQKCRDPSQMDITSENKIFHTPPRPPLFKVAVFVVSYW